MLQWAIDTIGKLGPFAVAFAVFAVNLRQNRWSNALARRSAEVEDQKFRLALIDRRSTAIDSLRAAYFEWLLTGRASKTVAEHLEEALRVARLVFDDNHEAAIDAAYRLVSKWQFHDRQVERWRDTDDARAQQAIDEQMALDEPLGQALYQLELDLREAAKVRAVPPIQSPATWASAWRRKRRLETGAR